MHSVCLLVETEFDWLERRTHMGAITERLFFRHSTAAPIVVLCSENGIVNLVRTYSWHYREWYFTVFFLKPSLKVSTFELLDRYVGKLSQFLTEMSFEVSVALLDRFSDRSVLAI